MDFSYMSKAEKLFRCIPWEVHGPEMNEGTAAMHDWSLGSKYRDAQHTPVSSIIDLSECYVAAGR